MLVKADINKVNLPDFLIVGAAKSGTTSLYYYLRDHPQIFMPEIKEPWFFTFMNNSPDLLSPEIIWKFEDYIKLFEKARKNQLIGEASPSYLYKYEVSIKNIRKVYGENYKRLKIIIVLRNPTDRAWSNYMMYKMDGKEPLDFEEAIKPDIISWRIKNNWDIFYDYIGVGMYFDQVKAYLEEFPNTRVFLYENLKDDVSKLLKEIYSFTDIDEAFKPNLSIKYNVSGKVKYKFLHEFMNLKKSILKDIFKPIIPYDIRKKMKHKLSEKNITRTELSKDLRKIILNIYEKDISNLEKTLKTDLSAWNN